MPNAAINTLRNESVVLTHVERDRPERAQACVRTIEEPETRRETGDAGDERSGAKRVFREGERRCHNPKKRYEKTNPCKCQQNHFPSALATPHGLDSTTSLSMRRSDGNHHDTRSEDDGLRDPGIHSRVPEAMLSRIHSK